MHVGTRQGNCIFPFLCLHQPIGCERKKIILRRHKNAPNRKSVIGSQGVVAPIQGHNTRTTYSITVNIRAEKRIVRMM
jgi:hypothetical protein